MEKPPSPSERTNGRDKDNDASKKRSSAVTQSNKPKRKHHTDKSERSDVKSPRSRRDPANHSSNRKPTSGRKLQKRDVVDDSSTSEEDRRITARHKMNRRAQLVRTLWETESKHAEELKTVVAEYMVPLRESQIVTRQQYRSLFCNLELIMNWHMQFLNFLKARLQDEAEDACFGDVFVDMLGILRQLYSEYSGNYQTTQATYKVLVAQSKPFESFVMAGSKGGSNNLLTLLYLPIGRMIMYDSLLKEIISCTPQNHSDYQDLCTALRLLRSIDKLADRVAKKRRNMDMVFQIQSQLNDFELAAPFRKYIHDDNVYWVIGPKSQKDRHMFLFNDSLLVTKGKKRYKKLDVHFHCTLDQLKIEDVSNDEKMFKIIFIRGDLRNTEYLFSSADKFAWMQLLNSTKKKLTLVPDEVNHLRVEEEEGPTEEANIKSQLATTDTTITKQFLIGKVLEWSCLPPEEIAREVKKLARKLDPTRVKTHQILSKKGVLRNKHNNKGKSQNDHSKLHTDKGKGEDVNM